jgi:hypothetical protein
LKIWSTSPHRKPEFTPIVLCETVAIIAGPQIRSTAKSRPRGRPAVMTTCRNLSAHVNYWRKLGNTCAEFGPYVVARTLSIMTSSGMYDYAGEWIYRVGMPAKSGVGGGIAAALPAQLGLGTFSPRLDEHGNSGGLYHPIHFQAIRLT